MMILERNVCEEEHIQEHKSFSKWLLDNADKAFNPHMPTVNTTHLKPSEVVLEIREWIVKWSNNYQTRN
jgi:hypothetical protein